MSSRTRGPRKQASKLPVADKPQFAQKKKKPHCNKVRKSKSAPAEPSHGTKAEVQKIATSPPHQGAKEEEPNIRDCPHQGSENIFSFIFCKPDCPRSAADSVVCDRSLALSNFDDDSSSSSGGVVEFDPAVPYVPFPGYDPTKRYLD